MTSTLTRERTLAEVADDVRAVIAECYDARGWALVRNRADAREVMAWRQGRMTMLLTILWMHDPEKGQHVVTPALLQQVGEETRSARAELAMLRELADAYMRGGDAWRRLAVAEVLAVGQPELD